MLKLIVTAPTPVPYSGSEPGKAFSWAVALSSFYQIHLVCLESAVPALRDCGLCKNWIMHPVSMLPPIHPGLSFYWWYKQWCDAVVPHIRKISNNVCPVGIHHVVLGSFRMLPAYQQLSIPYTLGPLGGGEYIPRRFVASTQMPVGQKLIEIFRPYINTLCVYNPRVRPVLRNATSLISTTEQTAQLLRRAGSKNVCTVFPDVTFDQQDYNAVATHRRRQLQDLQQRFELVFSGRALWWKGGHLSLEVIKKMIAMGYSVRLTMITGRGSVRSEWQKLATHLQLEKHVRWLDPIPKHALLQVYKESHAFLYPTMHDSSSSAIPEAYCTGLPSVTLGIGGAGSASTPATGFNFYYGTSDEWTAKAANHIANWVKNPHSWLESSIAAGKHADSFSIASIELFLRRFRVWK